ncbi:hypothetical protein GCM10011583_11900 [Streptomyces camponoticapitis]|uniref:Uncharacterized protein n=2 Tax=Streptomyces camponoticapitis TaxID=1616125 RepID=A0ABQ2E192_9ACTN|nr:hypothetical protein GCM10011583_11900 [Streptomyces camponoticapitis]
MPTVDQAIANAARLLERAEIDPNPQQMATYDAIAASWIQLASLLMEKERV